MKSGRKDKYRERGDVWASPLTFAEIIDENNKNLAELMDKEDLLRIAQIVIKQEDEDRNSRSDWEKITERGMELIKAAKADETTKATPWPGAANIKYPLLLQSIVNAGSRLVPSLIKRDEPVKFKIYGKDPDKSKQAKAERLQKYMCWQLIGDVKSNWWLEFDKSIISLLMSGTMFRKVCYDTHKNKKYAEMIPYKDIVVNNNVSCLDKAQAISQWHRNKTQNDIEYKIRSGEWIRYNYKDGSGVETDLDTPQQEDDYTKTYEFIEQHRYLDLDEDGYAEPYIVIVDVENQMTVRISRNFEDKDENYNEEGQVICLEPIKYYQDYHLIPSPDGSYYSMGFGALLLHMNSVINTIYNMALDAASLATQGGGFITKGARARAGKVAVYMNEWVNMDTAPGTKLKDNIVPHPTREPPQILMQLLDSVLAGSKEIAGMAEVLSGELPNRDLPINTLLSLIDESTKPFTAIYKRIYEALTKEFDILYRLNALYADETQYVDVLNDQLAVYRTDFDLNSLVIVPGADPSVSSDAQRRFRAQVALEASQMPSLAPLMVDYEVAKEYLLAAGFEDQQVNQIVKAPDPTAPPPPEVINLQAQIRALEKQLQQRDRELDIKEAATIAKNREIDSKINLHASDVVKNNADAAAAIADAHRENFNTSMKAYLDVSKQDIESSKVANTAIKTNLEHIHKMHKLNQEATNESTGSEGAGGRVETQSNNGDSAK